MVFKDDPPKTNRNIQSHFDSVHESDYSFTNYLELGIWAIPQ